MKSIVAGMLVVVLAVSAPQPAPSAKQRIQFDEMMDMRMRAY